MTSLIPAPSSVGGAGGRPFVLDEDTEIEAGRGAGGVARWLRTTVGAATGLPLGWTWPDDEAVAAYAEMQHDESMAALRGVLDWTRARQAGGRGDGAEPGRAANQG